MAKNQEVLKRGADIREAREQQRRDVEEQETRPAEVDGAGKMRWRKVGLACGLASLAKAERSRGARSSARGSMDEESRPGAMRLRFTMRSTTRSTTRSTMRNTGRAPSDLPPPQRV